MICVYDIGTTNFNTLGDAVLTPLSGKLRQVAGGSYDLTMECALDAEGKWKHLVPGAVLKVPVPKETIENAFSGESADIYVTNQETALRDEADAGGAVSYTAWNPNTLYEVGDKVSVTGWSHRNYQCTFFDASSAQREVPPYNSSWWMMIADGTEGGNAIVTLPAGTELYFVESVDETWNKMATYYGVTGYIQKSTVTYSHHVDPSEVKARVITEQLFRITERTIDNDRQQVSVAGVHVSYDLSAILIRDVNLVQAGPGMALGRLMNGLMYPYKGVIATNITSSSRSYTGNIAGKNGIYALLDPDKGIVKTFDAKLTRDNWDIFVMEKVTVDRGFQIRYGKNARGITWKRSNANLITRVVPVAKDETGNDLYLPEVWINSSRINNYPVIRMERLNVKGQVGHNKGEGDDSEWSLSGLYDEMRAKANARFTVDKADIILDEVTVQFEQIGDTAERAEMKTLEDVLLYDTIKVIDSEQVGMSATLYVSELEWDFVQEKVTGLKLTNIALFTGRTVTGYNVMNNSIGEEKLEAGLAGSIAQDAVDTIIKQFFDQMSE